MQENSVVQSAWRTMESKTTTISFSDMGTVGRAFWKQKITDDQLFSGRYPKKQWLVLTQ